MFNNFSKIIIKKVVAPEVKYSIILDLEAETILIVRLNINTDAENVLQPLITCRIVLTSPSVRADEEATEKSSTTTTTNGTTTTNQAGKFSMCVGIKIYEKQNQINQIYNLMFYSL